MATNHNHRSRRIRSSRSNNSRKQQQVVVIVVATLAIVAAIVLAIVVAIVVAVVAHTKTHRHQQGDQETIPDFQEAGRRLAVDILHLVLASVHSLAPSGRDVVGGLHGARAVGVHETTLHFQE